MARRTDERSRAEGARRSRQFASEATYPSGLRGRSAKPLFTGSNPVVASIFTLNRLVSAPKRRTTLSRYQYTMFSNPQSGTDGLVLSQPDWIERQDKVRSLRAVRVESLGFRQRSTRYPPTTALPAALKGWFTGRQGPGLVRGTSGPGLTASIGAVFRSAYNGHPSRFDCASCSVNAAIASCDPDRRSSSVVGTIGRRPSIPASYRLNG